MLVSMLRRFIFASCRLIGFALVRPTSARAVAAKRLQAQPQKRPGCSIASSAPRSAAAASHRRRGRPSPIKRRLCRRRKTTDAKPYGRAPPTVTIVEVAAEGSERPQDPGRSATMSARASPGASTRRSPRSRSSPSSTAPTSPPVWFGPTTTTGTRSSSASSTRKIPTSSCSSRSAPMTGRTCATASRALSGPLRRCGRSSTPSGSRASPTRSRSMAGPSSG